MKSATIERPTTKDPSIQHTYSELSAQHTSWVAKMMLNMQDDPFFAHVETTTMKFVGCCIQTRSKRAVPVFEIHGIPHIVIREKGKNKTSFYQLHSTDNVFRVFPQPVLT